MNTRKFVAALIVGAAVALGAPAAANAVDYTSGSPCSFDITVTQSGNTATLTCVPGTWADSETVAWTGSGQDGANIRLASFRTAVSSVHFSKNAAADGSDVLRVTLPADAVGAYTITGVGQVSGHVCAATLTVVPADTNAAVSGQSAGAQQVADTGSTIGWTAAWIGGGLVVAGMIALAIVAWTRRLNKS